MGPTRRERILAALAAAGDRTARDSIVDRLVAGARSTTREALARSIRPGGTVNDFPSGFWPGLVMITRGLDWGWSWTVPDASRRTWPDIELWNALLAARPSLHDDVLRRTAADPRVPDLGRAMLLGLLLQPRQDDTATLLAIARRGMAKDSLCIALPVGMKRNQHVVRFNVPLCTAAYALGRHRAVDALTALWRECPPDDHDLRGELTVALCQADTGLVVPLLVEYMRSDWNERAGSAAYVKDVLASAQARPPFTAYARLPGQHDLRVIDEPYRVAGITSQIAHRAEPESLISLITDPSLNPWLRLFWVFQTYTAREDMRPWVPALRGALAEMASKTTDGDSLRTGIDGARSWLDIGDKVYGEHSERVSARKLDWR
jgi:hypothetical protein